MRARIGVPAIVCAFSIMTCVPHRAFAQGAAAPSAAANASAQDQANDLVVETGKAVLVDTAQPVERIAIGSSDIAEATAVTPTEIMLNGKSVGETSLIVWQKGGGRQFFNVQVHPSNFTVGDKLDGVKRELRTELPGQSVRVTTESGSVFLRGTVKDLDQLGPRRADRLHRRQGGQPALRRCSQARAADTAEGKIRQPGPQPRKPALASTSSAPGRPTA